MISTTHRLDRSRESEVHCGADDRFLLKVTVVGIVIRCRTCKRDHELTWDSLDGIRQQLVAACGDERMGITG